MRVKPEERKGQEKRISLIFLLYQLPFDFKLLSFTSAGTSEPASVLWIIVLLHNSSVVELKVLKHASRCKHLKTMGNFRIFSQKSWDHQDAFL
ncbi:hypothetical protein AMECASPLE_000896 [Ameca splendens]|uniref:Uncharacterized protein n=1 Tax=Ameca splendens TaxID=208324 RepID=A0ABV0ZTS2_9TELE